MTQFRYSLLILALFLVGAPGSLRGQDKRPLELEDLFRAQRLSDPTPSPDGKWVAYVVAKVNKPENRTESHIWLVLTTGNEARQLTNGPKHDRHPTWSPDGKRLAFESDQGGSTQIYVIGVDGGEAQPLSSISTEASQPVWSPDGRYIAFISAVFPEYSDKPFNESDALNKKRIDQAEQSKVKARVMTQLLYRHWDSWVDGKRQHLFVIPASGGEPRDLTPGDRDAIPTSATFSAGDDFAFSPDGKEIAYTATPTPSREEAWHTNHDLYSVNLETGERRQLTTNLAADGYPRYSPDGKYLAYRAQARAGYEADRWQLMLLDRSSGQLRSLTANFDSGVEEFVWAPDSKNLYFAAEEKASKPLWSVKTAGGDVTRIVAHGDNSQVTVTSDGNHLVFCSQMFSHPNEVLVTDTAGGDPRALTHANDELLAHIELAPPESVQVTGAGGTPVQMWIIKPPGFKSDSRYPLVFWVHGGPQSAWMDAWSFRWNAQLWAAQGYVLALPNPRGSTGFGQKFTDEISGDWGGKVYEDLMRALAYLEAQPYVDTNKMAAAGASYGGYMMNWFQGHTDKFKTLVTHCGVYNFDNMYGGTDEAWFDEWDHGLPWTDPDFDKWSPHRFAGNFKTPNLIIHNELDFRIPVTEGLNVFTVLQRRGIPSKLVYFPDEGHWVLKPQNSEFWHHAVFDWLAEYLK